MDDGESDALCVEEARLRNESERQDGHNWKRWGPYLSERQWGTVREDYSHDGKPWWSFPHDQARSRAYRWGEDGLLGFTDRQCRLCFAIALWNGKDPILKERLFGVNGDEGNHGEDVKEEYYYLDCTPTHSYQKALYKYPQDEYPYGELVHRNQIRNRLEPELELVDLGIFDRRRYFDVVVEYAKKSPDDILIRLTIHNRGPSLASIHVLPTLWFRNTWSWGDPDEIGKPRPSLRLNDAGHIEADHYSLGRFLFQREVIPGGKDQGWLFTENESTHSFLHEAARTGRYFKDAFHRYVVNRQKDAVNRRNEGTKAAAHYRLSLRPGAKAVIRLRLTDRSAAADAGLDADFDRVFEDRIQESEEFYRRRIPADMAPEQKNIVRQAYAGLLWSKQFYQYSVRTWLRGDPTTPPVSRSEQANRNRDWPHLFNRDIISMPDKWEYPWYAAWDLAFHMIPFADLDVGFAREQLILFLREWYMHPNGQIPAYEWNFSDVNPPVHAWACWKIYKKTGHAGHRDRIFLARTFQKLLLNFTWWVNRKDRLGKHIFSGGFLGLDNIGVFDRSQPLPTGGHLHQADGTAWMGFFCANMLTMALELASENPAYADMASKFFEHYIE
ncbi:MAG: glucosidase, partial [Planctomycetaceae bacterium]|nr:glucosidase [Planctomycetaceae bacterium]